jgi:hypothetical protein
VFDANTYIICTLIIKSIFLSIYWQGKKVVAMSILTLSIIYRRYLFVIIDFLLLYDTLLSDNITREVGNVYQIDILFNQLKTKIFQIYILWILRFKSILRGLLLQFFISDSYNGFMSIYIYFFSLSCLEEQWRINIDAIALFCNEDKKRTITLWVLNFFYCSEIDET